ncbi:iron complex outermembrane recepter protein [Rhizobium sp. NFR07]|uniref:TonB-dependent siderophore receptor n=1 Tax=Rhizobium sp. NFR07 TaxID=1566262 RepID=UPI0008E99A84|nr:TonB-dependent siderophore receptor [Rhizobium sp. NFR07]SFA93370.1 iron complex outermembrane recepter protein [Rhizobium sp. NFR07]
MGIFGEGRAQVPAMLRLLGTASILALTTGAVLAPTSAEAQGTTGRVAAATVSLNIPAQDLNGALLSLADRAGVQVFYDTVRVRGLRSQGINGTFTAAEGLSRLLAGTGLSYSFTGNAFTIGTPGQAADAAGGDATNQLQPIIIQTDRKFGATDGYVAEQSLTATKTGASLIETPQSISVVTRKQLDDQNVQSVSQALRYTAGVTPESRAGRYDYPNIRGFGAPGGADANFVGLLDGMRLPRGVYYIAPSVDPYMLERVEVLRGPSSVLYGAINPGGVVNLWSKRPTEETLREVELQYGTFDRKQAGFDFSGPVTEDGSLLYRLTGVARHTDTQIDFTEEERYSIAPAITWQPDADTSLTVLGHIQNDPSSGAFTYLPYDGTVVARPEGFRFDRDFFEGDPSFDQSHRKQSAIGYEFEHRFNDTWTVRQNLRYMHLDYDYQAVFSNGWRSPTELARGTVASDETTRGFTVDTQAQAEFDTGAVHHTALFGLDYRRNVAETRIGMDVSDTAAPDLDVNNPVYGRDIVAPAMGQLPDQTLNQVGFYAQDQVKWDNLTWLVGVRADIADIEMEAGGVTTDDQTDHVFTWRTGLVYQFDNGIAPYASYATSFEPVVGVNFAGDTFKPTEGEQFEIGVKYQPTGWSGFLQASLFDLSQTNVRTADRSNPLNTIQTGEVRSRGLELEAHANITDDLSMIATYSYIDIEVTKDTTYQGKKPIGAPSHLASLWANYVVPTGALEGLSFGGGVRYVGSSAGDPMNDIEVPSYTLVDAALRYDFGALDPKYKGTTLSLNAANLFDKEYVASCWNQTSCFYGNGRTITASLKVRW